MSELPEDRAQRKRANNRARQRRYRARLREAVEIIDDSELDIVLDENGEPDIQLRNK